MLTIEARYEGEISEEINEAVMALCESHGVDTADWINKESPDYSKNVMTDDDDKIVLTWFWIKVATYDIAEELAAKLARLGLETGIDDVDNADLDD
jgi:hypothetical protein